jgi:hypothetical protein
MRTFTDNAGRVWTVAIHAASIKRVQGLLKVNLYKLIDDNFKGLGELLADIIQLVDVLYCLCKEEADAKNVSDEDFGRALGGDALYRATDAFLEELIDFFPDPRARSNLRKLLAEGRKVRGRMMDRAEQVLASFDADREANKLLRSFGIAPESSESTPAPSPSGNSA